MTEKDKIVDVMDGIASYLKPIIEAILGSQKQNSSEWVTIERVDGGSISVPVSDVVCIDRTTLFGAFVEIRNERIRVSNEDAKMLESKFNATVIKQIKSQYNF